MPNPFSGIITQAMKDLHRNMISSLLEDDALTVPVRFYYGITKFETCTNCSPSVSSVGRKGTSVYVHGGPAPFSFGQDCPLCGGQFMIPSETNESINLAVIFDCKKYLAPKYVGSVDGTFSMTFCAISLLPKILQTNYVIFDTNIEGYRGYKFQREGEPDPMGFGANEFILTTWKRI